MLLLKHYDIYQSFLDLLNLINQNVDKLIIAAISAHNCPEKFNDVISTLIIRLD